MDRGGRSRHDGVVPWDGVLPPGEDRHLEESGGLRKGLSDNPGTLCDRFRRIRGFGESIQKLGFVPEAQNDMIFSIICEELGFVGATILMLVFLVLIWRFMVIAVHAPDLFGSLIAAGAMGHIAIQVILNVAVVTNTIPNTGITLPFMKETVGKMRSSSLLLGPLLSRGGEVTTWYPGGCVIGKRPIDFHLDVLRAMGAEILDDGGMLIAKAETFCGTTFRFPYPSVGATENAVMAAVAGVRYDETPQLCAGAGIAELCGFCGPWERRSAGSGPGPSR